MIENYAEKIKHESNGFIRHNGIRIVSVDEERSVLEAEITDNSRNVWGSVHGGFLYTMGRTPPPEPLRASSMGGATSRSTAR